MADLKFVEGVKEEQTKKNSLCWNTKSKLSLHLSVFNSLSFLFHSLSCACSSLSMYMPAGMTEMLSCLSKKMLVEL